MNLLRGSVSRLGVMVQIFTQRADGSEATALLVAPGALGVGQVRKQPAVRAFLVAKV